MFATTTSFIAKKNLNKAILAFKNHFFLKGYFESNKYTYSLHM